MKMIAKLTAGWMGGGALLGVLGCATVKPPAELLSAREAYQTAEKGPAKELNPADLHDARILLENAESAARSDGDSPASANQAYLALRRAELANAQGKTSAALREKQQSQEQMQAIKDKSLAATRGQLAVASAAQAQTQKELAQTQGQLDAEHQKLSDAQGQVDTEHQARLAAEQSTVDALGKIADVRREARGMVITLSGSVLFASGRSELLPGAQQRLDQVAQALKGNERTILVEGHSDSRGSVAGNQQLSLRRAQSVLDYLVPRGIQAQRIRAVGEGSNHPIAENTSAEGRANNRRVEIVVEALPPGSVN